MIEPRYNNLSLLFANRVFRIPQYQRFYSWHPKQRADLFNDLKKLIKGPADQHHFMATIVCHRTPTTFPIGTANYQLYDVVDGQQRLTTLILLLKCIELALPAESDDRSDLGKILVKRDQLLILLQTNNANEHIFNQFIRNGTEPEPSSLVTHSDRNLGQCITDCKNFLAEWIQTRNIPELMQLVLHRLGFVVYDTEDSRAVYTLFEVLNSRGLAVDWLDKAKSVLMGKAFELGQSETAKQAEIESLQKIWGQIYLELASEDVPGEEILRIMATLYYGPSHGKPRSAEDSLEELRGHCENSGDPQAISMKLFDISKRLVGLYKDIQLGAVTEVLQARLLGIAILSAPNLTGAEREKLLEQWERVTFRIFGLLQKDSRTKVGEYLRAGNKIMTNDESTRTYDQIMGEIKSLGADYPAMETVERALAGVDFYESPEACRYFLWNYEEYLAKKMGNSATFDEHERASIWKKRASDSIEHIFPQNPAAESYWQGRMQNEEGEDVEIHPNVGRIGNLILLPSPLNSEAKTRPFPEKKKTYEKHHVRMIDEVLNRQDWDLSEIKSREKVLIEWAKTRWADIP
jgi:hypothetical protein